MAEPITNVLGTVAIKHCGEYDATMHYEKLNVVTYNGSSYCAKDNTIGNLPTNTTYWDLMAEKGDKGDTGEAGHTPVKGTDYYTDADKAELESTLASDVSDEVTDQLSDLTSATPLVASSTAGMTDTTRIYVNTADGHWYWYDGDSWEDGGVYQATVDSDTVTTINNEIEKSIANFSSEYFDENNIIANAFFVSSSATGTNGYTYNANVSISNPMYVKVGDEVNLTVDTKQGTRAFVVSDEKDRIISSDLPTYVTSSTGFTRTMVKSGYLRIAIFNEDVSSASVTVTNNKMLKDIALPFKNELNALFEKSALNKYKGKTMAVLGDSITYGYGTDKQYWKYIEERLELTHVYNYGINGSTIANGSAPMWTRIDNIASTDILLVFGGTNDFGYMPDQIGEQYTIVDGVRTLNFDANTFYGGLNQLFGKLVTNHYNKKLIILTPIHRQNFEAQPNDRTANSLGLYLDQYVEAIKNVGKFFGIEVTDLYSEFKYYPYIDAIRTTYFTDGLHPNSAGHEKLADIIIEKCFK